MKKILNLILFAGFIAAIGTITNSCAPTETPEVYDNALVSHPSSLSLTAADSVQTTNIVLSCGCKFDPLVVTGYGGDTSNIHFSFKNQLTILIGADTLQAQISPSILKSPVADTAWIALSFNDAAAPQGTVLYDTIRATANY